MPKKYSKILTFVFLIIFPLFSYGITPEKEKDLQRLMRILNANQTTDLIADSMVNLVITQERQRYPNMPKQIEHILSSTVYRVIEENSQELENMMLPIYSKYYTHHEIKELINFFNSPIGQKYNAVSLAMTQDLIPVTQAWSKKMIPILAKAIEVELKKLGYK